MVKSIRDDLKKSTVEYDFSKLNFDEMTKEVNSELKKQEQRKNRNIRENAEIIEIKENTKIR